MNVSNVQKDDGGRHGRCVAHPTTETEPPRAAGSWLLFEMLLLLVVAAAALSAVQNCSDLQIPAGHCWSSPTTRIGADLPAVDRADCCAKCAASPRCGTYVYWREGTAPWRCSLFSSDNARTKPCTGNHSFLAGTVSGRLPPAPAPPQPPPPPAPPGSVSVLMIAADDMRPELGAYGCSHMKTPHLDSLAADGVVFDRAYVAVAWCSPSRTALLTSRRADTSRTWSVVPTEYWRERGGNFTTLPQVFRESGFLTVGIGKIFHPGAASGNNDVQFSWSPESLPYDGDGTSCPSGGGPDSTGSKVSGSEPVSGAGPAMSPSANTDSQLARCGARTLARLRADRQSGNETRPFFFAVGFHKPHIPWTVPKEYYDRYPLAEIHLAPNLNPPLGVPSVAMNNILAGYWGTFSDFGALLENGTISKENPHDNSTLVGYWAQRARQAYWAATSFTDDNVGTVLSAAKAEGLYDSSVIVFWGDHGYALGDNDQWSKVTCFEHATRIPLIIKPAAGSTAAHVGVGKRALGFVETVDIMPSLVSLAIPGRAVPRCPGTLLASRATALCTDGRANLVAALHDPNANLSSAAFSQVPRDRLVQGMSGAGPPPHEQFMGYSIREDEFRYTEWHPFDPETGVANWTTTSAVELYVHGTRASQTADCSWDYESANRAGEPALASEQAALAMRLRSIVDDSITSTPV